MQQVAEQWRNLADEEKKVCSLCRQTKCQLVVCPG